MHEEAFAWTFYGREGCGCCQEAARLLLDLMDGQPLTLRIVDLPGATHPPGIADLPALATPEGRVVWQRAFDSKATHDAWEAWRQRHAPPRRAARGRPAARAFAPGTPGRHDGRPMPGGHR